MTHICLPTLNYHSKFCNFKSLFNHIWQSLYAPARPGRFLGMTSDLGLVTISFPVCCVSHRATGLPVMVHDMHTRRRPDYLQACPTGPPVDGVKSALTPALWPCAVLWPCTFCSDPFICLGRAEAGRFLGMTNTRHFYAVPPSKRCIRTASPR